MAKKYYWLKLQKDFFKRHDIRIIEDMPNGKDYILFYMKLLVESISHEGSLRFNETIPYNEGMLATVTNTNIDIVRSAVKLFGELGLMDLMEDGTLYMSEVQTMMGVETDWAEKKRLYRETKKLEGQKKTLSDKSKEIELDIELKKDIEKDYTDHFNKLWLMYPRERRPDGKKNVTSKTKKILFNISKEEWQRVLDRYKKEYSDYKYWKHCFRFMNNETFNIYLDVNYIEPKQTTKTNKSKWDGDINFPGFGEGE